MRQILTLFALLLVAAPLAAQPINPPGSRPIGPTDATTIGGALLGSVVQGTVAFPGGGFTAQRVPNTAALKAITLPLPRVTRDGFYAAGDGGAMDYTWSSSNCAAADDGVQVQPAGRTGCWLADTRNGLNVKVFGAKGDDVQDDGPMIRAAVAACTSGTSMTGGAFPQHRLFFPSGSYRVASLDPDGTASIVFTPKSGQATCEFEGEAYSNAGSPYGGAQIHQTQLDRPVIRVAAWTASPTIRNMTVYGGGSTGAGYPGGPGGKLYVIQIDDQNGSPPEHPYESAIRLYSTAVTGGFNGNLYLGTGRGTLYISDFWTQYSGQARNNGGVNFDCAIMMNGFDSYINDANIGPNYGTGICYKLGSQHFIANTAIYFNNVAEYVGAGVDNVQHVNMVYNDNQKQAVIDEGKGNSTASIAHIWGGSTVFSNNSKEATGVYSDFKGSSSYHVTLENPIFVGGANGIRPKYNIETGGTSRISVTNPHYSTTSYTRGFTDNYGSLVNRMPGTMRIGNVPTTTVGGSIFTIDSASQYSGWSVTNGSTIIAQLIGTSATNDVGNLTLFNGGTATAQIAAGNGNSYIVNGNFGIGTNAPSTKLDVAGGAHISGSLAVDNNIAMSGVIQLKAYTVATLPSCTPSLRDAVAAVSDARSPTYRGTLTGGGAVRTPVYCDGSVWTAH